MKLFSRLLFLLTLLLQFSAHANALLSDQCQPLKESSAPEKEVPYDKGLLWKISKNDEAVAYVYGTIHVSDKEVTTLPTPVQDALNSAEQFAMEALPDTEQMMILSSMMFFHDGQRLSEFVDTAIYEKTAEILARYSLGPQAVAVMKPWAAFLLMNYPPDTGEPLDLVLLGLAVQNGTAVNGLESLEEQGRIFNDLALEDQARLLTDTVCHYDVVESDFSILKSLYLERDLGGLYNHANRYDMMNDPLYERLMQRLINDRNSAMVERMQSIMDRGVTFVAIGAMHLTGEEGVLALLEKMGYQVSAIF